MRRRRLFCSSREWCDRPPYAGGYVQLFTNLPFHNKTNTRRLHIPKSSNGNKHLILQASRSHHFPLLYVPIVNTTFVFFYNNSNRLLRLVYVVFIRFITTSTYTKFSIQHRIQKSITKIHTTRFFICHQTPSLCTRSDLLFLSATSPSNCSTVPYPPSFCLTLLPKLCHIHTQSYTLPCPPHSNVSLCTINLYICACFITRILNLAR